MRPRRHGISWNAGNSPTGNLSMPPHSATLPRMGRLHAGSMRLSSKIPAPTTLPTATGTEASRGDLPTPVELAAFLADNFQIKCLDPNKPHQFWPGPKVKELPFSDALVVELRGLYRNSLLSIQDYLKPVRKRYLTDDKADTNESRGLNSQTLFEVVGAHLEPRLRLAVCMRMALVTQDNAATAVDPEHFDHRSLHKYLKDPKAKPYRHLKKLCHFLNVEQSWIERGPKTANPLEKPLFPWWLDPWWELSELASELFDLADLRGMLPMKGREPSVTYDFAAFWARWKAEPSLLPITKINALSTGPLSLLPWLFEARVGFRCGNPTYNVTCTADTFTILQRLKTYYTFECLPKLGNGAGRPLPAAPPWSAAPPSPEDMILLEKWMNSPPFANPVLTSDDGVTIRISPTQVEAPTILAVNKGQKTAGRPPGSKNKPKDTAPSSDQDVNAAGEP